MGRRQTPIAQGVLEIYDGRLPILHDGSYPLGSAPDIPQSRRTEHIIRNHADRKLHLEGDRAVIFQVGFDSRKTEVLTGLQKKIS